MLQHNVISPHLGPVIHYQTIPQRFVNRPEQRCRQTLKLTVSFFMALNLLLHTWLKWIYPVYSLIEAHSADNYQLNQSYNSNEKQSYWQTRTRKKNPCSMLALYDSVMKLFWIVNRPKFHFLFSKMMLANSTIYTQCIWNLTVSC